MLTHTLAHTRCELFDHVKDIRQTQPQSHASGITTFSQPLECSPLVLQKCYSVTVEATAFAVYVRIHYLDEREQIIKEVVSEDALFI